MGENKGTCVDCKNDANYYKKPCKLCIDFKRTIYVGEDEWVVPTYKNWEKKNVETNNEN